jgi:hypothetical protein
MGDEIGTQGGEMDTHTDEHTTPKRQRRTICLCRLIYFESSPPTFDFVCLLTVTETF